MIELIWDWMWLIIIIILAIGMVVTNPFRKSLD